MNRMMAAFASALLVGSVALGHALYVIPEGKGNVIVVFGHALEAEPVSEASWKRMAGLKLTARDAAGKPTPVTWKPGKNCLTAVAPADSLVVSGTVETGVFKRGDNPARRGRYFPKAVLKPGEPRLLTLGSDCPLEVVPLVEAGKVRFLVLSKNQPVAQTQVEVIAPEKDDHTDVTTDEKGLTPAFDAKGLYGVTVRQERKTPGELNGVKYDTEVDTATLVVAVQ